MQLEKSMGRMIIVLLRCISLVNPIGPCSEPKSTGLIISMSDYEAEEDSEIREPLPALFVLVAFMLHLSD